ncbi:MAG: hypothetical protein DRJ38_03005 [Thermoprotei archaeon]|nr:MAG: hypothetical protein DRJ38_03005 [Thermoprotei archaeon]
MKSLIKIIAVIIAFIILAPTIIEIAKQYVINQVGNLTLMNLTENLICFTEFNVTCTNLDENLLLLYFNSLYNFFINHLIIVILAAFLVALMHVLGDLL